MNEQVRSHLSTSVSPVGRVGVGSSVVMTLDCESPQRVTRPAPPHPESRPEGLRAMAPGDEAHSGQAFGLRDPGSVRHLAVLPHPPPLWA